MTKVVKFGGTSLADANQFRKIKAIVNAEESRKYVVPSAPGKRSSDDTKITDMLYNFYDAAQAGTIEAEAAFLPIKQRYDEIISDLGLNISLDFEYQNILKKINGGASRDYAASRGEYLSGIILASFLGFEFIDAASVIFFNKGGSLDDKKTYNRLAACKAKGRIVIPGFYGSLPDGHIKTFSRGGSDITGSVVAKGVGADLYENWTDVSGFLAADPRIIENPDIISRLTYRELRELSYMGATVFHEDAIFPAKSAGITINIKNTNDPEAEGTLIVPDTDDEIPSMHITGIAGKKNFTSVSIDKDLSNDQLGFGRKILQIFEENEVPFEHLPSSIDTMTVIVNADKFRGKEEKVIAEITKKVAPNKIKVENEFALIAVVGRRMHGATGMAAKIFESLSSVGINIKMIIQGPNEINIIIGIHSKDFEKAIQTIYNIR